MSQLLRALGVSLVLFALMVGVGTSGDAKKDKDPGKKLQIPTGWGKLMLSKEQHDKVIGIASQYNTKISALEKQIADLKAQRLADQVKILTEEQKGILLKGLTGDTKDKDAKGDKAKADK